jgi:hypothetical protein
LHRKESERSTIDDRIREEYNRRHNVGGRGWQTRERYKRGRDKVVKVRDKMRDERKDKSEFQYF